jgi:hypothetical protein
MVEDTPEILKSAYQALDEMTPEKVAEGTAGNQFRTIAEEFKKGGEDRWSAVAATENAALSYHLDAGELGPMWSYQNGRSFPDAACFDDESLEYLRRRVTEARSPVVKARYSHILWDHPKTKHRDHALAAIDAYLNSVPACTQFLSESSDRGIVLAEAEMLLAALGLSAATRTATQQVLETIESAFAAPTLNEHDSWAMRTFVCRDLCKIKFLGRVDFLKKTIDRFGPDFDTYAQKGIPFVPHDFATAAVEMCRTAQLADKTWLVRRAKAALANAESGGLDNVAALSWIHDAIQDFLAAGDKDLADIWLREYEARSGNVHYGQVSTEVDMSAVYRQFDEIAKRLLREGATKIFEFLAGSQTPLVPKVEKIREQAKRICESSPLMGMGTHVIQDKYGRPVKEYTGPEGALDHWTYWVYGNYVSAYTLALIKRILVPAVGKRIFTSRAFYDWLVRNSWLGTLLSRPLGGDERLDFRWVDVIIPAVSYYQKVLRRYLFARRLRLSIRHFLSRLLNARADTEELPELLLPIDSLATKMEGIIRDFLGILGSTTTEAKHKGNQRTIEGRSLDKLLEDQLLADKLGEDDVFLIRFILTEKGGWNLRAEVAHSLLSRHEYRVQMFHMLLLIVFRLSRFQAA